MSMKVAAGGNWTFTFGCFGSKTTPVALWKNPDVCNMAMLSPLPLRVFVVGLVGEFLDLLNAAARKDAPELPLLWCETTCLLIPCFTILCDLPTGMMFLVGDVGLATSFLLPVPFRDEDVASFPAGFRI